MEHLLRRSELGDVAGIHDPDLVADLRDDPEIVRNEEDRHVRLRLEVLHQLEYLCLDSDVERGRWLVRDEELWIARHHHCNHRSLAHATAELERILSRDSLRLGNSHLIEQLDCPTHAFVFESVSDEPPKEPYRVHEIDQLGLRIGQHSRVKFLLHGHNEAPEGGPEIKGEPRATRGTVVPQSRSGLPARTTNPPPRVARTLE